MDSGDIARSISLILMLSLSGFFSSAETALTTVNLNKLKTIVDEGGKRAKAAQRVLDMRSDSSKLLSTILIGNNIVNISASAIATVLCTNLFGNKYVGYVTGLLTLFVLVFGEITPKTLASLHSLELALRFSFPIYSLMKILTPVIWILNKICRGIFKILRVDPDANPDQMTESELLKIVDVSTEEGVIEDSEKEMINNVVEFGDVMSRDIMVPRADMVCLDVNSSYEDIMKTLEENEYSKIPVFEKSKDSIIGILYIKDILLNNRDLKSDGFDIRKLMRSPLFVYEYQKTTQIFSEMRKSSVTMCIVLDEYGVTAGLICMEDLIEEIVGEIHDEYDTEQDEIIRNLGEGRYDVDGAMRLDDLSDVIGTHLSSENYDSIGGLMIEILDRFPKDGEVVMYEDLKLKAVDVKRNRVGRVLIEVAR